ncbi:MAG: DUF456 domain-containing protein [Elusimicrobiota bacterium]|nr:DUF456 domain-containing protein [Elusimicrobiota bacterium]
MKIPRLALLAFLALAAPYANAGSLPTWPVIEEGPRAWARVFFKVGTDSKTLRCRYNDCKPESKGISNLYTITPVGTATPTKVTIYKLVPRSKWNPRYHTDGPYERVPEVINAKAQPYASELSHFKLDNTGAQLVVVQGGVKYPATTDISQAQYNSYDQLKVAPPTKMIDDVVRPAAPAPIGPPAPPRRGNPATVKWWCDPATGEKYSAARPRRGSTLLPSQSAECKKTAAPTPGPVVAPPAPVEAEASLALTEHETRWLTREQADAYASVRKAAKNEAAIKAADAEYRALVEEQTRPEAKAKYAAAHALPPADAPKKIEEALAKVEMWGGEIKEVVGPFTETADAKKLEVQLSKADYEALKKKPADLATYETARATIKGESEIRADGTTSETRGFNPASLDPVALHLTVVAAKKALAGAAPTTPPAPAGPEQAALLDLLTDDEMNYLLTPTQRDEYRTILDGAPEPKKSDRSVQERLKILRPIIESRRSNPYPKEGLTESTFDAAPGWHKDKFCSPDKIGGQVAEATEPKLDFDPKMGSLTDLKRLKAEKAAAAQRAAAAAAKPLPPWAVAKCKGSPFYTEPAGPSGPREEPSGIGNISGGKETGPDTVGNPGEEGNKWVTKPLIQTAVKGALIGLLIGSLFGPVGLIAGPLIGAALFYGMSKYDEIKADNAKENKPE